MPTQNPLSDSLAHAFFDSHPHAVLVFDAAGDVVHSNSAAAWLGADGRYPSFAQMTDLGWDKRGDEPRRGKPDWSRRLRVCSLDGSSRHVDASLFAAQHQPGETTPCFLVLRHDGAYRWVMDTAMPRIGADGAFLGYVGSCLDITERKQLEDQLAEHTRNLRLADRRREDFLARLSHELRNPLAPIANAAAILRRLDGADDRLVMVREIVERQVDQLRRLITDLVDVTRITKGKIVLQRESVDINSLVDSAIDEMAPEIARRHQFVRVARPFTRLSCHGDALRLSQALAALLRNAVRFSPDGSTILIST